MATRPAGPPRRVRTSSYWGHVGQLIGVQVLGMLSAGAVFLARAGMKPSGNGEATYHYLNQALQDVAIGVLVAIVGWIVWTLRRGRLRVADVATALFLVVVTLIGFVMISYNYYAHWIDE